MIVELGHFSVILALLVALLPAAAAFAGDGFAAGPRLARQASFSVFWLCSIGFLGLAYSYLLSDFSVINVASNSHSMKPLIYKFAAMWGNHEGSMLMWVWMLAGWGAAFAAHARTRARKRGHEDGPQGLFATRVLAVQGLLVCAFALFLILTSNPFLRMDPPAPEGMDLNPLLQDPLLAIHPPFLYFGVSGFSLAFSFAVAALWGVRLPDDFAAELRPWVLTPWAGLTFGITLGSIWAYYELGWGGFWFWDPVENVSLLPWLAAAALLHSLRALERRHVLPGWTLLLAILCFILSVLGTFLVRSGLLTSVHAFASDPLRGVFLLAISVAAATASLTLYALRAPQTAAGAPFGWLSRDAAVLVNNLFMCVAVTTVFLGTVYPVLLSALGAQSVSVGAPYYAAVMTPLLLPFAAAMGVAPMLAWRQTPKAMLRRALQLPLLLTVFGLCVLLVLPVPKTPFTWVGMAAGFWILSATLFDLLAKSDMLRRWRQLTRAQCAMSLAHAGFGVLLVGITAATQWASADTIWMTPGSRANMGGQTLQMVAVESDVGRNYNVDRVIFSLQPHNDPANMRFVMPEKRWYPVQEKETSESALTFLGFDIFYAVLGDRDPKNPARWVVRLYYHPLIILVFAGGGMIALGGLLAAGTRRHKGAA